MKLTNIVEITAKLVLKTGLYIGTGNSEMHIGGVDNPMLKNPVTKQPYIPGSSFKGKIRSLLEWRSGQLNNNGNPLSLKEIDKANDPNAVKQILALFGVTGDSQNDEQTLREIGVSRLAFWDCTLNPEWLEDSLEINPMITEVKSENTINRITSVAEHPRFTERVPAGAEFDFKLTMRQFEGDSEALLELILKGLRLLELDSLGGSGSRGYGKVAFMDLKVDGQTRHLAEIDPFA